MRWESNLFDYQKVLGFRHRLVQHRGPQLSFPREADLSEEPDNPLPHPMIVPPEEGCLKNWKRDVGVSILGHLKLHVGKFPTNSLSVGSVFPGFVVTAGGLSVAKT